MTKLEPPEHKTSPGCIMILILIVLYMAHCGYSSMKANEERAQKRETQRQAEEAFRRTPAGQDKTAKEKSEWDGGIAISPTGQWFYRGMKCTDDCSGHIAGYSWAVERGVTNSAACEDARSYSFYEGCKAGAEDVLDWIREQARDTW